MSNDNVIRLVSTEDLAINMGYAGANSAFREWCASLRISPVPGRRGWYDMKLVRRRLDEAQGLNDVMQMQNASTGANSLVEMRKARRGTG